MLCMRVEQTKWQLPFDLCQHSGRMAEGGRGSVGRVGRVAEAHAKRLVCLHLLRERLKTHVIT